MADYSDFVPDVHFEKIPIKNLVSNQTYQRNLSIAHIQKTAGHFDVRQINPVKVSRRDGINYVFNGQHTIEIVASVSGSRDTPVWCMVYDGMDYMEEADTFAKQQKFVKPLMPYEIFMANIEAGNDDQILMKSLVESYRLRLSSSKGPNCLCAISTIESIYHRYGLNTLDRTLRLCVASWEGEPDSLTANITSQYHQGNCFVGHRLWRQPAGRSVSGKGREIFFPRNQPQCAGAQNGFHGLCGGHAVAL